MNYPRTNYEMSKDDLDAILAACKSTPVMMIGDYESFEDAVAKLGKAFVLGGNYLMTSAIDGDAND